jgi:hypothetical protein
MDDIDVRNRMRADKRKGVKKGLSKRRNHTRNVIRYNVDKRKGEYVGPNTHRENVIRLVKKERNEVVVEPPKVVKARKKRVETRPRKTKYFGLTAEEKEAKYRERYKNRPNTTYINNTKECRKKQLEYYYENHEKIAARRKEKRQRDKEVREQAGIKPKIGRPRKYDY